MKKLSSKIMIIVALVIGYNSQLFCADQKNMAKHTIKEMTMVEKCKAKVGACARSIKSLVWGDKGWKNNYMRRIISGVIISCVSCVSIYGACKIFSEDVDARRAAAELAPGPWMCLNCLYRNEDGDRGCGICGRVRGSALRRG